MGKELSIAELRLNLAQRIFLQEIHEWGTLDVLDRQERKEKLADIRDRANEAAAVFFEDKPKSVPGHMRPSGPAPAPPLSHSHDTHR